MMEDDYIASLLLKHYGNLLKVSRSRDMTMSLPSLRKYVKDSEATREAYNDMLLEEIRGMGLHKNKQLESLRLAQKEELELGSAKNNTTYSEEIKKIIEKGEADRKEGEAVSISSVGFDEGRVGEFIKNPIDFDIDKLSSADRAEVKTRLLDSFEQFVLWSFKVRTGQDFMLEDFHHVLFDFCQRIIDGEEGFSRAVIGVMPRAGKTEIISIQLPLYSFCHNYASQNMLLSFNEGVILESSGYIRETIKRDQFRAIFSELEVDPSKRSLDRWGCTKGGVLHAITGSGMVTGRGCGAISTKFSGIQCIDDKRVSSLNSFNCWELSRRQSAAKAYCKQGSTTSSL